MNAVSRGRRAEAIAATYLELLGFRIRRRNLRVGPREIDLIASRDRLIVFVEVKLRTGRATPVAAAAVDRRKRLEILRATGPWIGRLQRDGWRVRYDVVAIRLDEAGGRLELRHFPGAFGPPLSFVT